MTTSSSGTDLDRSVNRAIDRQAMAKRLADVALLRGEFTLRSGRTSSYYLDKYRFTTQPAVLADLAVLFEAEIRSLAAERTVDRLAGAELGGIPLVTAAGMRTGLPIVFIRNQKKDYGTAQQLEGPLEKGDAVVFLEDVATTAGQAAEACQTLRDAGAEVLGAIAVVDRQEGAAATMAKAGVPFRALFTKADLGIDE
ncbi:MAG: orotate phosphoribosyltransferase [Planctomycetota bacterium]